jgi:predicted DCC family thiol-disulfide oxidoreductase YuxK
MYVPIDPALLPKVHPELTAEACRREMHVVTSEGQIFVGWDGVMYLARLFPLTWLIGVLGSVTPLRWLGRRFYRFIACHRSGLSKCRLS